MAVEAPQLLFDKELFYDIWRNGIWIALNSFLHPVYSIINAMVLGHQTNEKMLAGLGLGSITNGIFALSIGSSFTSAGATFISHAYG